MTSEQFVYWMQGFLEISGNKEITPEQVNIIKDHISLVLTKVTPTYPLSVPYPQQIPGSPEQLFFPTPPYTITC